MDMIFSASQIYEYKMLSQNQFCNVKSDQTTPEVIELAKFPGHDPG